ncbi:MAG: hypothetical protein ACYTG5_10235 [Planctomycetota bacterium]|jgi:hypothetical protein
MTRSYQCSLLLLGLLAGLGCHSSDNVSWFVVSNPSGEPLDPNNPNPNPGGGTIGIIKTAQAPGGSSSGSSREGGETSQEEVLPLYLERFLDATRTAIHANEAIDWDVQLVEQAELAIVEEELLDVQPVPFAGDGLPVIRVLDRLESLPADSQFPSYEQAMQTAANLRLSLAAIDLALAFENFGSGLYELPPIQLSGFGQETSVSEASAYPRPEYLRAAREQVRAAYQDFQNSESDLSFIDWVRDFAAGL